MKKIRKKYLGLAAVFLAAASILLPLSSKALAEEAEAYDGYEAYEGYEEGEGYDGDEGYESYEGYVNNGGYDGYYVVDNAGLLSYSDAQKLEEEAERLSDKYGANIVILTENVIGESDEEALQLAGQNMEVAVENAYAAEYYDAAYGVDQDGIICYVDLGDRYVVLDSTGDVQDIFDMDRLDSIREDVAYYLSSGNYARAFEVYLMGVEEGFKSEGVVKRTFRIFSAVGSAVVSALAVGVSKSKMNTAKKQVKANRYQKPGSMKLMRSSDIYLYSNVNCTKRSTERRTGGGGGGHFTSSGGGSHTSSGGHF